jgi:hypothetical protein
MHPAGFATEGEGWRLALEAGRHPFAVLIGGDGWAAELSLAEAAELRRGLMELIEQHAAIAGQLMAEENLELDLERGPWWLGLTGDRHSWALRFVLAPADGQRGLEGSWTPAASSALAQALAPLVLEPALCETTEGLGG